MSRIKLDSLSEETINSSKVVRGPKCTEALSEEDYKNIANVKISAEIKAKNARDALEKVKVQLYNAIEDASEKSAQTRVNGYEKIIDILTHHCIPEIVVEQKLGITETVEKSLRRVNGLDQAVAAKTAALLVIQLGNHYDNAQVLIQYLEKAVTENSNDISTRTECCNVLGILYFLRDENIEDLEKIMNIFESIFNIRNMVAVSESESVLQSAAIFSWGLLFTKISSKYSNSSNLSILTNHLIQLLESPHLNLRVAAGELLCLILENSRSTNNTSLIETIEELVDITKSLSNDTQKFRHKHDLKQQRATFRDISRYIEENIIPDIKIVFGDESIEIKTWALHQQYVALCSIIGPGIVTHLIHNEFIRNALNVDEIRIPLYEKSYKHELRNENDRTRTLERRDDRRYKSNGLENGD